MGFVRTDRLRYPGDLSFRYYHDPAVRKAELFQNVQLRFRHDRSRGIHNSHHGTFPIGQHVTGIVGLVAVYLLQIGAALARRNKTVRNLMDNSPL